MVNITKALALLIVCLLSSCAAHMPLAPTIESGKTEHMGPPGPPDMMNPLWVEMKTTPPQFASRQPVSPSAFITSNVQFREVYGCYSRMWSFGSNGTFHAYTTNSGMPFTWQGAWLSQGNGSIRLSGVSWAGQKSDGNQKSFNMDIESVTVISAKSGQWKGHVLFNYKKKETDNKPIGSDKK